MAGKTQCAGNIVKTYKFGTTAVKICDNVYKQKTNEDVQEILKKIKSIGIKAVIKKVNESESGQEENCRNLLNNRK
ncbi:MAG: hypothetical protein GX041_06760 [Clostridiales bacterium]|jgi:hypothetical protein|nr:hypothetical protein [Clostridiales bacterium]